MKTVFKVGMKVYDSVNYPGEKGEVIKTEKSIPYTSRPIQVKFESNIEDYTLDGRIGTFNQIPTLSTSPYTLQGFEQKAPVPTFEEVVKDKNYIYLPENLVAPNKELADATKALLKLLFLRDYYNDDWQPDLKNKEQRGVSVILDSEGNFFVWGVLKETETHALVFKDEKVAKRFIEEQKKLLEIAKPLL